MKLEAKKLKWLIAKAMTVIMLFSLLPNVFVQKVQATEVGGVANYEIYPIPQSVEYNDGKLNISQQVNVVFEENIDEATKNRLFEVLAIKGISHEVTSEIKNDKTNFIVGINNSNGVVDSYFNENNLADDSHFENMDSHIISAKGNVVAVLGKDTDSAFYGITTLKHIFNQESGNEIRNLLIKDFANGQWRGFIEGYYGIPWSNENRKSLMEFGGDFKMNAYIFAPKDDEYHSLKWRELYPEEKLAEIREMVEVGTKTKNKFIWTIHPFLNGDSAMRFDTEEHYKEDLGIIIAKFEQLYEIGVRQFGVLADDAEGDESNQVKLMKDLEKWRLEKGDIYNLIFVPKVYTKESAGGNVNNPYLNTMRQMPETVDIMWTGDVILGWVTKETFDFFEEAVGREAFMWLNWPVNDINNKRLLMGKGQMLDPTVTNFKGIVTNPMQEAQASKPALFAIADYGWNRAGFNVDKSWEDSFKYIDKDATEELYTFAKHMSDPAPNWHGLALDESEEIKPIIEEFTRMLRANESILEYSNVVLAEYNEILDATINFEKKSKNELMKKEIKPWVDSLKALAESTIAYVNSAIEFEKGNYEKAMIYYGEGADKYTLSRSYRIDLINDRKARPEPGTKHLIPFIKDLSKVVGDKIDGVINPDIEKLTLRPYTNMGPLYDGHIFNIADGNSASRIWIRNGAKEGDYMAVELSKETEINSIIFEQGETTTGKEAFNYGKFQYSMDGENWTDLNGEEYGPQLNKIVVEGLNVKAKHVRFIPTGEIKGNWISIREFSINKDNEESMLKEAYTNVDSLKKNNVSIVSDKATLTGVEDATLAENDYIGIKLNKIREITKIIGDYTNNDKVVLESSINGIEWTEVTDLNRAIEGRYVRIINKSKDAVNININNLELQCSDKKVTFVTRPSAEAKFEAEYLIDGLINTTFKPSVNAPKTGELVYRISDETNIKNVTVIQNPSTISNAVVSVRTENGWSDLGELGKSFNVFDTVFLGNIFEIKIAWDGMAPILHEIGLSRVVESNEVNKEELAKVIAKAESLKKDDYTKETWTNLEKALKTAKELMAKEDVTQDEVNSAVESLNKAISELVKNPGTPGGDNNNGGNNDGNNGGNGNGGSNNGGTTGGGNNSGNTEPGKGNGNLPNTGGQSAALALLLGTAFATTGTLVFKKKNSKR